MQIRDQIAMSTLSLFEHRTRSALSMLGIAIGIASVVLVTSVGEGARQFIVGELLQFGTNLLQINPGKTETFGMPGATGGTTHKLTLEDCLALRRVPGVQAAVPLAIGQARVEHGNLGRNVMIVGSTPELPDVWNLTVRTGRYLPDGDPRRGAAVIVLGAKVKRELFGDENALGRWVRAAGMRFRVIGVLAPKGQLLAWDMDDMAHVPVTTAQQMFNLDELIEIDVVFSHEGDSQQIVERITRVLKARHGDREDFTIMTQAEMLEAFAGILQVVTLGVSGVAAISLVVGAIGILTTMWIVVGERTHEIGLMRAIGASPRQVLSLFLLEAIALSILGGLLGLGLALGAAEAIKAAVPAMPLETPVSYVVAALSVSAAVGLIAGVAPAQRAAGLEPVEALREE